MLKPNEVRNFKCYTDKHIAYPSSSVITVACTDAHIPDFIDVTPSVNVFEFGKYNEIFVTLSNLTTNTVAIQPKAILGELQPVTIATEITNVKESDLDYKRSEIVHNIVIENNDLLTAEQIVEIKTL